MSKANVTKKSNILPLMLLGLSPLFTSTLAHADPQATSQKAITPPAQAIGDNSTLMGDIAPSSMGQVMRSFSLEAIHQDPNDSTSPVTSVVMHGTIYAACADKFDISNTVEGGDDSPVATKDGIGFKVTDPTGNGLACVKALSKQPCTTKVGAPNECIAVSTHFPGATMDLSSYKNCSDKVTANVGLIYATANNIDVPGGANFSAVDDKITASPIVFKNAAEIKDEALTAAKAAKDQHIQADLDRFTNCQDSLDHLPLSQRALKDLRSNGYPIQKYLEMQKQLDAKKAQLVKAEKLKELLALHKRVKNVKSVDDADEINDDLTDFATNNSEYEKTIAAYKRELAQNVADLSDTDPEAFQKAHDIVADAAGMDGLTKAQQLAFKNDALRYQIGGVQAQAKQAASNGTGFGITPTTFYGLAEQARTLYTNSCSGKSGMSDACSEAFQNAKAAVQIPQYYQQAVQQNAQFLSQFQTTSGGSSWGNQGSNWGGNQGSIFNTSGTGFGNQNIFNTGANAGLTGSIFSNNIGGNGGLRFN